MARPATPATGGPAFIACLNNEFQQGLVNAGLYQEFRGRWASSVYGGPNVPDPDTRADAIIRDMQFQAAEDRRRALLQWSATRRVAEAMRSFRNRKNQLDAGEFALEALYSVRSHDSSIEGRSEAIFADFQTDLSQFFQRFRRRDISGTQMNRVGLENVLRELDGQATNDPVARAMALAWQQTSTRARLLFNAAGGNIPRLDRWLMPQVHNSARIGRAGFDEWRAFVAPRLDLARMIDGRTGQPMQAADLDAALQHVFTTITTNGAGEAEAQLRGGGQGILALQRLDHRFLVFNDADAWLQYQGEFGSGELIDVMFHHLRSMSKDIAAMQEFGPDPAATVQWLKQTIQREMRLSADGDPDAIFPQQNGRGKAWDSFSNPNQARADYAKAKVDALTNLWDVYTGKAYLEGSQDFANAIGTVKNVFLANALGSTTMLAQTDHVLAAVSRAYAGLPWWRTYSDYLRAALPGGRQEALELGILSESALNTFMTEMRFIGPVFGKTWSRWLVERSMTVSLLKPHTAAMKNAFGLTFFRHLAAQAPRPWANLSDSFRDYLSRYGLGEQDWDAIRATPTMTTQRGLTVIHHRDVANAQGPAPAVRPRAGYTPRQELALRLLEMVRAETEAAVPSGNLRSQRFTSRVAPGTVPGALWQSVTSLKSYGLAVHTLHMYRMFEMLKRNRVAPGTAYMVMLITGGTGLGFLIGQAQDIAAGRGPRDPSDANAWKEALIRGAALGIFAEPLIYGENAEGRDVFYELMGPLVDQAASGWTTGAAAVDEIGTWMSGEEKQTNAGREALKLLKKVAPFSTLFYTRLATDRLIYDNLQRMVDGEADDAFERRRDFYQENKQQGFWWGPGDREPRPQDILGE
jgi:hypothetical protein